MQYWGTIIGILWFLFSARNDNRYFDILGVLGGTNKANFDLLSTENGGQRVGWKSLGGKLWMPREGGTGGMGRVAQGRPEMRRDWIECWGWGWRVESLDEE